MSIAPLASKKAILLVGTMKTRPFMLKQAVRAAESCGFIPMLVDNPEQRALSRNYITDAHFIGAGIDAPSATAISEITTSVAAYCAEVGIQVAAVYTCLAAYTELAGVLVDHFEARGNSGTATRVASTKTLMREALMDSPGLTTPYRIIESAGSARSAFRELGSPVVVKPARGAGSRGVRTGIRSERQVEEAWESVRAELAEYCVRRRAGQLLMDSDVPIMVERQLIGWEVDVEIVLQNGDRIFGVVADNPEISLPINVETSTTYPSCLPQPIQDGLVDAACAALRKLGLTDGNFHVEMNQTHDGPRIIEVNTRIGGAFVWQAINCVYGVNLVELGVKAVLGVPIDPIAVRPSCVLEARFFIPAISGRLLGVEGFAGLTRMAGFRDARLWKNPGDMVFSPADDPSDYLGFALFSAQSREEARKLAAEALRSVRFLIRTANGETVQSPGSFKHEPR
jgi:biotin carboxylase